MGRRLVRSTSQATSSMRADAEHNAATEIRIAVEHRLGEVLAATVNHKGGRPSENCTSPVQLPKSISRNQSSRAQAVAAVPLEAIRSKIAEATAAKVLADENDNDYNDDAAIQQETVRAVVKAYAEGKIELERPKASPHNVRGLRVAPHFAESKKFGIYDLNTKLYNVQTVANFLGWTQPDEQPQTKVRNALLTLEEGLSWGNAGVPYSWDFSDFRLVLLSPLLLLFWFVSVFLLLLREG